MRSAQIQRNTNETKIQLSINLDGRGEYENKTGVGFLDHMLDLFARHGRFDFGVEEKRYEREFLRFGNVQLLHAQRGDILRQPCA